MNFTFTIRGRFLTVILLVLTQQMMAQIINTGCVKAKFGVDAGLYSGIVEYGTGTPALNSSDWFLGPTGIGIIDESQTASITSLLMAPGNPNVFVHTKYPHSMLVGGQMMIDGLYSRDQFGGTGFIDNTSYNTASKNGEDPAIWDPGPQNVLGKNDLIDVFGTMYRDGTTLDDDLYFA